MKRTVIISLFYFFTVYAFGQNQISVYREFANQRQKFGIMAGKLFIDENQYYKTSYGTVVGVFYQSVLIKQKQPNNFRHTRERIFYGAYTEFIFNSSRKITISFNIRTGVQNGVNFVITPMLKTGVRVSPKVKLEAGLSQKGNLGVSGVYSLTIKI